MSFGQSGFGGFGSNSNNQQQNTGFGFGANTNNNTATGGFGTTGNAANSGNTGFGNTGAGGSLFGNNNTNTTSGFGAGGFGANNNTSNAFGARPGFGGTSTSSGGLFGGNSTTTNNNTGFGGGFGASTNTANTGFGATNTGGSLFGQQNQNQSSGFGGSTGGSLFGGGAASTGFGNTNATGFGQSSNTTGFASGAGANTGPNNGTGGTPFQPFTEKDGTSTSNVLYQSVTCQPQYQNFSFEELRMVDYNQGRKYANQNSFGASSTFGGFGSSQNQNNTSGFGTNTNTGGGLFGQQSNNNTTGFGNTQQQSTGFGASGGGLFGQPKPASTGLFGNTNQTQGGGGPGGGLFTNSNNNNSGFGQSTGAFGNSNNNTTGGGLFGQNNNNNQNKPLFGQGTATGFGTNTNSAFGQSNNASGGLFGNNTQNTSVFGNNQAAQNNTSLTGFGQNNQAQNQNQSGGLFGNSTFGNSQAKPSLFGASNTTGSNLFGQNNQQQGQLGSGLFGNNNMQSNQQQGANSGGLFGAPKPANQTGGLFGNQPANNNAGGGLFGGLNNQPQQNQGGGLFGQNNNQQKPGGLFGSTLGTSNNSGGLFGNTNNTQQQGGILGNSTNNMQSSFGSSLFGNSPQNQQQAQQPQALGTSIMSPTPYGNDSLFAHLGSPAQSGPLATPLSSSQKARKPAALPAYRISPAASMRYTTPQKSTGYGFYYSTYGTPGSAMSSVGSPGLGSVNTSNGLISKSLTKSQSTSSLRNVISADESVLNTNAFQPGGLRSFGGSMKKLKINRNLRSTDLFGPLEAPGDGKGASPLKKTVSFEAENAREDRVEGDSAGQSRALVRTEDNDATSPADEGFLRSSRGSSSSATANGASNSPEMVHVTGKELAVVPEESAAPSTPLPKPSSSTEVTETHQDKPLGEYWMSPSKEELAKMSKKQLVHLENFVVGRDGAGKIKFGPVDLSTTPLDQICGGIVRLTTRNARVYEDDATKPPEGKGLNVPSTVILENSWPRAKGGRVHVYETSGPRFDKHLERLKRMKGTEYVGYDLSNGSWTFKVHHFSSYGLDYADYDDDSLASSMLSPYEDDSPGEDEFPFDTAASVEDEDFSEPSPGIDDTFEFRRSRAVPGAFDDVEALDHTDADLPMVDAPRLRNRNDDDTTSMVAADAAESHIFNDVHPADTQPLRASVQPKSILKNSQSFKPRFGTPSRAKAVIGAEWTEQLQRTISPKKQDREALRQSQGSIRRPVPQNPYKQAEREVIPFKNSIDVMNSLFGKSTGVNSSRGKQAGSLSKGFQLPYSKRPKSELDAKKMSKVEKAYHASFEPSWTSEGTLIYATEDKGFRGVDQTNARTNIHLDRFLSGGSSMHLALLERQRVITDISMDQGVPRAQLSSGADFNNISIAFDEPTSTTNVEEWSMWGLASVLFDQSINNENDPAASKSPKERLSDFWRNLVSKEAETQAKAAQTSEEKAIAYLSRQNTWEATRVLADGGDVLLATMIAQLGGTDVRNEEMRKHIDEWRRMDILSEMTIPIRTLYELLAGNTCVSEGKIGNGVENKAETFTISSYFNLGWRRVFGLKLWYGTALEASIADAVHAYKQDVNAGQEPKRPVPSFVESNTTTSWQDDAPQSRQSVLWTLLRLAAEDDELDVIDAITPQNLTGNPFDARCAFQLFHILAARGLLTMSKHVQQADALTSALLYQLSALSAPLLDQVFVALHLSDPSARYAATARLLEHHAGTIGDSTETCPIYATLTGAYFIPETWIWSAKALYARAYLRSETAEVACLLRADRLVQAHETFRKSVAPRCVVEEDSTRLRELIELFVAAGAERLEGWEGRGGGFYADYLELLDLAADNETVVATKRPQMEDLLGKLGRAVQNVGKRGEAGLLERVAAQEIAEAVRRGIAELEKANQPRKVLRDVTFQQRPMAEDRVIESVLRVSESYYGTATA